jgi:hypothetical protein
MHSTSCAGFVRASMAEWDELNDLIAGAGIDRTVSELLAKVAVATIFGMVAVFGPIFLFSTAHRKSIRIRNCLATMRQVGLIFGKEYGFSFLGSHVGQEYAQKHLRLKFETEIKAFLTCGNSPRRFISIYSNPQVFWEKVRRQGGPDCGYIILP